MVRADATDVIGEHAAWLGRSIEGGGPTEQFAAKTVRLTINGIRGDSGLYYPSHAAAHADPDARRRLYESEVSLRMAIASRQVVRQAVTETVGPAGSFVATSYGYDGTTLLPPYLPVLKGEDTMFGVVVDLCVERAATIRLPWTVEHRPVGPRQSGSIASVRSWDYIHDCVLTWKSEGGTPRERMRALGHHLVAISSWPRRDFERAMRMSGIERLRQRILRREKIAKDPECPPFARVHIAGEIAALRTAILSPERRLPIDVLRVASPRRSMAVVQRVVGHYGRLLTMWPDLVDVAGRTGYLNDREVAC